MLNRANYYIPVLVVFILFIGLPACNNKAVYHAEIELPQGVWLSSNAASFKPELTDTVQFYDINLILGNSNDYRYSNIWFFVRSVSPAGLSHIDTVEVLLAEDNGKWFGDKSGELYSLKIKYKKQVRFPVQGVYTFDIVQGMRDTELKGIHQIGIEMLKSD
jgi:gliding motility-associated lipoprotein GldH